MLQRHPISTSQVVIRPTKPSPRRTHSISQVIVSARLVNSSSPHLSFVWFFLVYYRIYAEDGAIPSKTPGDPGDPFLGRIDAISVPPPHTIKAIKHSIAKVENIKNRANTSLFVTPYSQSPMHDADKVRVLNNSGIGSTPQEPLALVAKISDSERSALESERRDGLASAEDPDATPQEIRYRTSIQHSCFSFHNISTVGESVLSPLRRRLWSSFESSRWSKEAFPWPYPDWFRCATHSLASIKRCMSRVERTPAFAHTDIFASISPWRKARSQSFSLMA